MNEGFPFADLVFLAIVAGFILLRLRSVLGKKMGHDGTFGLPRALRPGEDERVIQLPDPRDAQGGAGQQEEDLALSAIGDPEVASALMAVRAADPEFQVATFLSGAKIAFEMVFDAFRKQDEATLKRLLSPEVFGGFAAEMAARKEAAQWQETTLVSVTSQEIVDAKYTKPVAQITVRFISEQIHVLRDNKGEMVGGNPSAVEKVEDEWVFERDLRSRNPNWTVVAT